MRRLQFGRGGEKVLLECSEMHAFPTLLREVLQLEVVGVATCEQRYRVHHRQSEAFSPRSEVVARIDKQVLAQLPIHSGIYKLSGATSNFSC